MIDLWLGNITDVILYRTELVEVQKPQPVNPELTPQSITGILDILNNFRGKRQRFGNQASISLVLGNEPTSLLILFFPKNKLFFPDMKVIYDFPKLLSLFS